MLATGAHGNAGARLLLLAEAEAVAQRAHGQLVTRQLTLISLLEIAWMLMPSFARILNAHNDARMRAVTITAGTPPAGIRRHRIPVQVDTNPLKLDRVVVAHDKRLAHLGLLVVRWRCFERH